MSAGQRLPEDIAAEQAYIAELRAQQSAARRAALSAQGLLDDPAAPVPDPLAPAARDPSAPRPTGPAASPAVGGIAPEKLASLSPDALAALPEEVRELILEAQARQRVNAAATPASLPQAVAQPGPVSIGGFPTSAELGPGAGLSSVSAATEPAPGARTIDPEDIFTPELSEEELQRRELLILSQVKADLGEQDSVLVRSRKTNWLSSIGASLDGVLGFLLGRNKTW